MATLINHSRTRQRMLSRYASFSHFAIKLFFAVPLKNCHSSRLHGGSQAPLSPPPVLACGLGTRLLPKVPLLLGNDLLAGLPCRDSPDTGRQAKPGRSQKRPETVRAATALPTGFAKDNIPVCR